MPSPRRHSTPGISLRAATNQSCRCRYAAAISATEAVPGTFRDALTENETELRAAHTAIQAVTDILKTDFLSILDLEAPDRAAGDND